MALSYHVGTPVTLVNNTGISAVVPQVSFNQLGNTITISLAWEDTGPGGVFPPVGTQMINYSDVPNVVSYLTLSSGAWQCKINTNYTAQPSYVGKMYRNVLELWDKEGLTKLKGPSSGSLAETALAQGVEEWKTNPGTITVVGQANAQQYLMKVWSKDELTGAIISNQLQYILTQGEATGTQVNPIPGPWDVSYRIKKGTTDILPPQLTAGITQKTFMVSRDNPMQTAASDYAVEVTVKRSTETTGEVISIPIVVVTVNEEGENLHSTITNSVDGTPIAPGGTAQVKVNEALAFNVLEGKTNYSYNFRFGTVIQGTLITGPTGSGTKTFILNTAGNYNINVQDPLTGATSGWSVTATSVVDPPDEPPQCPTGYHWDENLSQCVANTSTPPPTGKSFLEQLTALFSNAPVIVGAIAIALALRKGGGRK